MSGALMSVELERSLQAFVYREARLLDEGHFDQWDQLFAPEGLYWLPASSNAEDPLREASHLYDDRMLRRVHIERLKSAHAHSQQPAGRCHHLMQQPEVLDADVASGVFKLRTAFLYTELRSGRTVSLPGVARHTLRRAGGDFLIMLKRVDLLHGSEPLPAVEFYV